MAQSITDQTPLLPKPTLQRAVSRRSFAVRQRPSLHHLRRKLRAARTLAARLALRRPRNAPTGIDYFTTKLPAEIRLRIYGYVLCLDVPLKLVSNARHSARPRNLEILRVNRLTHNEALAALYEANTVCADRAAFCNNVKARPYSTLNHDLIRNLYITNLAPSPACEALRTLPTWPAPKREDPCVYCDKSILPLIRSLRYMPRLRSVFIDFHGHADIIPKLAATLEGAYGRATDLRLTCVGVGKYTLAGPWLPNATVELRDVLLSEIWTRLLAFQKFTLANVLASSRELRAGAKGIMDTLAPRFGKSSVRGAMRKLVRLFVCHDHGTIPQSLADIWPEDVEMAFKAVEACGPQHEGFLHAFNVEMQRLCAEGVTFQDLVARRGVPHRMPSWLPPSPSDDS